MKPIITGIVVEYNPFHNGHIHHIQESRTITKCDVLIAIMSPNFVQRGEPAFINKWERTEAALNHGVDLVIELPTYYAIQSADYFAMAAIELLNLANIDTLVYGAESFDLTSPAFDQSKLDQGFSYPAATNSDSPNNILALAYEKQLQDKQIKGIRIQRTNNYHDTSLNDSIASASAIRLAHQQNKPSHHTTPMRFDTIQTHRFEDYHHLIEYNLMRQSTEELAEINLMSEGIENLLIKNRHHELVEDSTNKRYTRSRIQRTLMNVLLNFKKNDKVSLQQFRVLGMNAKGQAHLKTLDNAKYTTQFKHYNNKEMELKASEIYSLPYESEYRRISLQKEIQCIIIKK